MYAVLIADGCGREVLEYPLLLGLSRVDNEPDECAVDAPPVNDQLFC